MGYLLKFNHFISQFIASEITSMPCTEYPVKIRKDCDCYLLLSKSYCSNCAKLLLTLGIVSFDSTRKMIFGFMVLRAFCLYINNVTGFATINFNHFNTTSLWYKPYIGNLRTTVHFVCNCFLCIELPFIVFCRVNGWNIRITAQWLFTITFHVVKQRQPKAIHINRSSLFYRCHIQSYYWTEQTHNNQTYHTIIHGHNQ